jgi:hypothetical protein
MWLDYKGQRHFLPTGMPEEPDIQGYYFSRPLPEEEFNGLLIRDQQRDAAK